MVGLSASELRAETLFPGDTVEYYSMAFVAGDARGHRVAKVLQINRKDDEFPVRVDTEEMLPLTMMLKRKRDRNDVDISSDDAKWRKLRTFRLVDGEVEGETRADRLNAGLKRGILDAMKSTKKQLAMKKAEKAYAGCRKLMSDFFTAPTDEGETTSSPRSSLEKQSTPERRKKRKPLTPRDNTNRHSRSRAHEKVELEKSDDNKVLRKKHVEDNAPRPEQKFKYDSVKHTSMKRKRSDSTPTKPKKTESSAPRKTQHTISKFFNDKREQRRPKKKRTSTDLSKFVHHVEEKDEIEEVREQKRLAWGINEYEALEKKERELEAGMKTNRFDDAPSPSRKCPDGAGNFSAWKDKLSNYRQKHPQPGNTLRSWLQQPNKRKGQLEAVSGGTPEKSNQRVLNLSRDGSKSPKMNRKNLNFVITNKSSNETSHRSKEMKRGNSASKPGTQLMKKRGSLGTVSARAPTQLILTGKWNHRKPAH